MTGTAAGAVSATPRQRGFSIVAALFLIVVLAAVGVFAIRIGTIQQHIVNYALLVSRATAAADAGAEIGVNRALVGSSCLAAAIRPSFTQALAGYTVSVTCTSSRPVVNGTPYSVYRIQSTATRGTYGRPDYVSRVVIRTVTNAP